jgi:hypothetical protein
MSTASVTGRCVVAATSAVMSRSVHGHQRCCGQLKSRGRSEPEHESQIGAWQHQPVGETTNRQLRVIRNVVAVTQAAGISAWLFGGWGLDARIGRITREHGDVEFWVERINAEHSKAALLAAGATDLATQPPAEACEFRWDGVPFSTAYFDRQTDGSFSQPLGRWSDWLFPPGSFADEPGTLDGTPVLAMSVAGMLAMKEQFPHLRNGRPWRPKDIADISVLRELAARNAVIEGR